LESAPAHRVFPRPGYSHTGALGSCTHEPWVQWIGRIEPIPRTRDRSQLIAEALLKKREFNEAAALMKAILDPADKLPPPKMRATVAAIVRMRALHGEALGELGQLEEAHPLLQRAVRRVETTLKDPRDVALIPVLEGLARLLRKEGNEKDAEPQDKRARAIRLQVTGRREAPVRIEELFAICGANKVAMLDGWFFELARATQWFPVGSLRAALDPDDAPPVARAYPPLAWCSPRRRRLYPGGSPRGDTCWRSNPALNWTESPSINRRRLERAGADFSRA
jgi:hypothetical protein